MSGGRILDLQSRSDAPFVCFREGDVSLPGVVTRKITNNAEARGFLRLGEERRARDLNQLLVSTCSCAFLPRFAPMPRLSATHLRSAGVSWRIRR